jgi:hypothetical protein
VGSLRALSRDGCETDLRQGVMANATDGEPWHGVVFARRGGKKNKTMQDEIANCATWLIVP